jgi:hypothetical protein
MHFQGFSYSSEDLIQIVDMSKKKKKKLDSNKLWKKNYALYTFMNINMGFLERVNK